MIVVERWADATPSLRSQLGGLLFDYHRQTEWEKAHGDRAVDAAVSTGPDALPQRYRAEIESPNVAFAHDEVMIARDGEAVVGCVVLTGTSRPEAKRLWVSPVARRRGVASRLLAAAVEAARAQGAMELRLSVWAWRTAAIALYERDGFVRVPSWDPRPGLVCLVLAIG